MINLGGRRMDSHSWSNRKRQGAIFSQSSEKTPTKVITDIRDDHRRNLDHPSTLSKHLYVIGKAYNEPCFCDHVETFILQRNFIID